MYPTYRDAMHTQSVLTITSNVVYGKATGNTPDGRKQGRAVRARRQPDERPRHARRAGGAAVGGEDPLRRCARTASRSRCRSCLRRSAATSERLARGVDALDAYFSSGGFHVNINVLNRETLHDAMEHPEKYPQLTIRVSGYAVNFVKLTQEQQLDVINRTFHGCM